MVKIGDIIGGYRLVAELGGGGFATVYKGEHVFFEDKPVVAIKVLHPHLVSQEQQTQFIREAKLLKNSSMLTSCRFSMLAYTNIPSTWW